MRTLHLYIVILSRRVASALRETVTCVGTSVYVCLCATAPQWQGHADEPDGLPEREERAYVHL